MNADASCQSARARIIRTSEKQSLLDYPWSSIALAYGLPPKKRKKWMDVATGLSLVQSRDTVAGRRKYVERLDQRALLEQTEAAAKTPGESEDQSMEVENTLRRGWYWGSQAFGEWLIDKVGEKAVSNADHRASPLGTDHAEVAAARWIERGCKDLKLDPATELRTPKRGDLRRAAIAWAIWKKTSVSQDWIAEKLGMKSRQNVSQQIRRFEKLIENDLPGELKKWKKIDIHRLVPSESRPEEAGEPEGQSSADSSGGCTPRKDKASYWLHDNIQAILHLP